MKKAKVFTILLSSAAMILVSCGNKKNDSSPSIESSEQTIQLSSQVSIPKVGSIIEFGTYEQDGDTTNGKEPIQWKVKAVDDNKLTLLSEHGLDAKKFNEESASVSWETCTLRTWLNGGVLSIVIL